MLEAARGVQTPGSTAPVGAAENETGEQVPIADARVAHKGPIQAHRPASQGHLLTSLEYGQMDRGGARWNATSVGAQNIYRSSPATTQETNGCVLNVSRQDRCVHHQSNRVELEQERLCFVHWLGSRTLL